MKDDNQLIRQYLNGQAKAFDFLIEKYRAPVFAKIFGIVKNEGDARDVMQETFVKALDSVRRGKYNEEGRFYPWLMRIAHNKAIDHYRKAQRYPVFVPDDSQQVFGRHALAESNQEERLIEQDTLRLLHRSIRELPEAQQRVLLMRNFMGMSFQEIAEETGVSINTALGRMRYALTNLRKRMVRPPAQERPEITAISA